MYENNDYLAMDYEPHMTGYLRHELELSWSNQLDVVGMQPHSREYLEFEANYGRSARIFEQTEHEMIDHAPGIQFSGRP